VRSDGSWKFMNSPPRIMTIHPFLGELCKTNQVYLHENLFTDTQTYDAC
jgi:hypothetical protein